MTPKVHSEVRRRQIVDATLELLATTPVDRISTRLVARRVGISQPALFRHFRSREALLEAVAERTRAEMGAVAAEVLEGDDPPLERAEKLIQRILQYAQEHPGVPRLLFTEAAGASTRQSSRAAWPTSPSTRARDPVRAALTHLVAAQRTLMAELVREAQRRGEVPFEVDAMAAGALLVAMLQGMLLQWDMDGRTAELRGEPIVAVWRAGLEAGEPRGRTNGRTKRPVSAKPGEDVLPRLDVRPILAQGTDPLDVILSAVGRLPDDGLLTVLAPFEPKPLLALLRGRGYQVEARQAAPGTWEVEIAGRGLPAVLDLSDREPPEPMERVLAHVETLDPGQVMVARLPRRPELLLPHLDERRLVWALRESADGTALLHVRRPA